MHKALFLVDDKELGRIYRYGARAGEVAQDKAGLCALIDPGSG